MSIESSNEKLPLPKEKKDKLALDKKNKENKSGREKSLEEGGAAAVLSRNGAIFSVYRRLLGLTLLTCLLPIASFGTAFYFWQKEPSPIFLPVDEQARLIPLPPVSEKMHGDGEVLAFSKEAFKKINSYDYLGWRDQLNEAQMFFSPEAWNAYSAEFKKSNTLNTVKSRKMIVRGEVTGAPDIVAQGIAGNGVYAWRVEIPVRVSYIGHVGAVNKEAETNIVDGKVVMTIRRASLLESQRGLFVQVYTFIPD